MRKSDKKAQSMVLLSWIAVNNDPFESKRTIDNTKGAKESLIPGPTLTLLFDTNSPYCDNIGEVIFFCRKSREPDSRENKALSATITEIKNRNPNIIISTRYWHGEDPTDHQNIFNFLRKETASIRQDYKDRQLIIHISPGTPSMHTIWVLMAETGMIDPPVELVKSYRRRERKTEASVVPVKVGLESFFKVYKKHFEENQSSSREDNSVFWDPRNFKSVKLKTVFSEARRYAQLNVPLLILGERGTGKTTLASWIRANSKFRKPSNDGDWPSVPCGQYSTETMRSELFGYKKGAFTGASENKEGLLSKADGDTLFLDEIGDISNPLQRLLIRAVEEHIYSPLGSTKLCESQFRLITATNRKMSKLRDKLKPDFLDRISMLRIEMPPLREIREDIPWLWAEVVAEAEKRSGSSIGKDKLDEAADKALPILLTEPLQGNMRDLFVVAYRMIAALADEVEPVSTEEAAEYGLEGLPYRSNIVDEVNKGIMNCFANGDPLDFWIKSQGNLDTKALFAEVRQYLAHEIRRYAKAHSMKTEELCDVAARTMREWC